MPFLDNFLDNFSSSARNVTLLMFLMNNYKTFVFNRIEVFFCLLTEREREREKSFSYITHMIATNLPQELSCHNERKFL